MSEQIFTLLDEIYEGRKPLSALSELSQEGQQINYFHLWVQHRIAKECVKEQDAILKEINSHIKLGVLPGNGLDQTAERNGLITASNIVTKRYVDRKPSFIPMAHESKSRLHGCSQCDAIVECVGHEHDGGLFVCSECNDEREHYHGAPTYLRIEIDGQRVSLPAATKDQTLWELYTREGVHIGSIPCEGEVEGAGSVVDAEALRGEIAARLGAAQGWLCANHPPGSEIEVKKGEGCSVCGRGEG
jgi:hypothetical protein